MLSEVCADQTLYLPKISLQIYLIYLSAWSSTALEPTFIKGDTLHCPFLSWQFLMQIYISEYLDLKQFMIPAEVVVSDGLNLPTVVFI